MFKKSAFLWLLCLRRS